MVFLEISQHLQKNTCARVSFLIGEITLVGTSVTQILEHYDCVKYARTKRFYPCKRKYMFEKSHTPAPKSYHVKCCLFVSVIVGQKLNEKRLSFFYFFILSLSAVGGKFQSS